MIPSSSAVGQFDRLDRDHDVGVLGVVMKDVVLHFLVVGEAELAVRALPGDLIHTSIVRSAVRARLGTFDPDCRLLRRSALWAASTASSAGARRCRPRRVIFTADPSTGDRSRIVIEAAFGLGEVVVAGEVEPDAYILSKDGPRLFQVRIGRKTHQVVRGDVGVVRHDFSSGEVTERELADDEALHLARLALRVETHDAGEPQDVEWAIAAGETFLVQSRAITALTAVDEPPTVEAGCPLLRGWLRRRGPRPASCAS